MFVEGTKVIKMNSKISSKLILIQATKGELRV